MLSLRLENHCLYDKLSSGYHSVRRSDRYWAGLSTDLVIEQTMMKSLKGRGGLTHGRGMTESVRTLWVYSVHECAIIRAALASLAGKDHSASPHVELGKSRSSRDFQDLGKILHWFLAHNPFDLSDMRLHSLSSGVVATDKDCITYDTADDIGHHIVLKMHDTVFTDVALKKADQVRTLSSLNKKIKIAGSVIDADSGVLFGRLLIAVERKTEIEPYFKYELTAVPAALFKDRGLRKTVKSDLTKDLTKSVDTSVEVAFVGQYVLDGECLLHRVVWPKNRTYLEVEDSYLHYIRRRYTTKCVVVFDGYENGPSIKDHEHTRRASALAPDIRVEDHQPAYTDKKCFSKEPEQQKVLC